jgi:hypothetical protein
MPELRKLGDDVLSFPKAVERVSDLLNLFNINVIG